MSVHGQHPEERSLPKWGLLIPVFVTIFVFAGVSGLGSFLRSLDDEALAVAAALIYAAIVMSVATFVSWRWGQTHKSDYEGDVEH